MKKLYFKEKNGLTRGRACDIIREVKRFMRFPQPLDEVPEIGVSRAVVGE